MTIPCLSFKKLKLINLQGFTSGFSKAYHRRGSARAALKKYPEAKQDFEKVLKFDPKSKVAMQEIEKIERVSFSCKIYL